MSQAIFELKAEDRADNGKGASRRLRHANKVPAILYGGEKEPKSISLEHNKVMQALDHEAFYSHILTLEINNKKEKVVLKDLQRHPYKRAILHMDFQRVSSSGVITMDVPIHFLNEDTCVGVKDGGGVISHHVINLHVKCKAKDLPEFIEIDVKDLELDKAIHASEIKLPNGVEIVELAQGNDISIVSVHTQRKEKVEEPKAEETKDDAKAESKDSKDSAAKPDKKDK